jgi:hypothetical protein
MSRRRTTSNFSVPVLGSIGSSRPVPLRLRDGAPGERRERELGVIPQVEPPLVPATVRAGQRHREVVVVVVALLRLEIGATDHRRVGAIPQAGEHEELLEQVPVGADARYPSHIASKAAICWMLFGLRC